MYVEHISLTAVEQGTKADRAGGTSMNTHTYTLLFSPFFEQLAKHRQHDVVSRWAERPIYIPELSENKPECNAVMIKAWF